jgi:hypothetical protein
VIDGALALMDSMTREDLEGEEFEDTYIEALSQIIEAKREHREPPKLQEPEAEPGQIVDLMAALTESVQQARASRGEDADVHELPKKKAAKKQPAKKATAMKTTKKAAARKRPGAGRAAPSPRCRAPCPAYTSSTLAPDDAVPRPLAPWSPASPACPGPNTHRCVRRRCCCGPGRARSATRAPAGAALRRRAAQPRGPPHRGSTCGAGQVALLHALQETEQRESRRHP